jgi:hypothetical protein
MFLRLVSSHRAFDFERSDVSVNLWISNGFRPLFPESLEQLVNIDFADSIWILLNGLITCYLIIKTAGIRIQNSAQV